MTVVRFGGGLLALVLSCAACDQPGPPPVAVREPSVDADDLAVIRGLIDDQRRRAARPQFLVVEPLAIR